MLVLRLALCEDLEGSGLGLTEEEFGLFFRRNIRETGTFLCTHVQV